MNNPTPDSSVERLFPFVLRAGILLIGREKLRHSKGKLHFVLITDDIAENHREEVLADFKHYPVVQHFVAADLEKFFKIKGAKAIGFAKSGLAQSIYAELKGHRIPAGGTTDDGRGVSHSFPRARKFYAGCVRRQFYPVDFAIPGDSGPKSPFQKLF